MSASLLSDRPALPASRATVLALAAVLFTGLAWPSPPAVAADLPRAPEGVRVREVTAFPSQEQEPVRVVAHPFSGHLYVLGAGGDVTLVDPASGTRRRVLAGADYIDQPKRQELNISLPIDRQWVNSPITLRATLCLGMKFDREGRLYVVANVQVPGKVFVNRVDLYRSKGVDADGVPSRPEMWTRFAYPYGVGGFNHGACHIAQGPDGKIYLGSGSRTDHGEAGDQPNIGRHGEGADPDVPDRADLPAGEFTAAILRFDPARGQQVPEVYSRGNRNPFGFDWDGRGRLIDAENGPMADHPEELNCIRQGKHYGFPKGPGLRNGDRGLLTGPLHYGFPFEFGNGERPDYADAVKPPPGLKFERPIKNVGPGGLLGDHPMYSLAPHSSPCGMVFYRKGSLPKRYENTFFLARFGNLVGYNRIGFDVLNIRLEENDGELIAHTERFLERLGRPIDVCVAGGKLYVVEYCRQTETAGPGSEGYGVGGRVLEVSAKP
jgi:hypothetical protein